MRAEERAQPFKAKAYNQSFKLTMLTNIIYRFQYKPCLTFPSPPPPLKQKPILKFRQNPKGPQIVKTTSKMKKKKRGGGFKLLDIQMSLKLQDLGSYPVTSTELRSGLMGNFWKWREQMILPHCQFLDVTEQSLKIGLNGMLPSLSVYHHTTPSSLNTQTFSQASEIHLHILDLVT